MNNSFRKFLTAKIAKSRSRPLQSASIFCCATAVLAGALRPAHAQVFELPSSVDVPSIGSPLNSGSDVNSSGQTTKSGGGASIVRPVLPASSFVSTSLEYESWDTESRHGFSRVSGSRTTALFSYANGGPDKTEVGISVPLQRVKVDGLGVGHGVGDIGLSFRKYFYDDANPNSLTIIASLRGNLPSGDANKGLGLGRPTYGPSLSLAKPISGSTLLYSGVGYNYASGESLGIDLKSSVYAYAGGVTRFGNRLGMQYEATYFTTPFDEKYTRVLVGPQFYVTPSQAVQINFRKELKAAGKPFGVSLGYSSNF